MIYPSSSSSLSPLLYSLIIYTPSQIIPLPCHSPLCLCHFQPLPPPSLSNLLLFQFPSVHSLLFSVPLMFCLPSFPFLSHSLYITTRVNNACSYFFVNKCLLQRLFSMFILRRLFLLISIYVTQLLGFAIR